MSTWDIGAFGNDGAADFAVELDEADPEAHEPMVRGVLERAVDADGDRIGAVANEAVAAAALVAAQCPGGEPVQPHFSPQTAMPPFPDDLRRLADEALVRVVEYESGPDGRFPEGETFRAWCAMVHRLREVLVPTLGAPLFEVGELAAPGEPTGP